MTEEHKDLTTNFGAPVPNNQDSLTAGKRDALGIKNFNDLCEVACAPPFRNGADI